MSRYYQTSSSQADQAKQKAGPCGVNGDKRTTNASLISTFKPGETITVTWRETIQHPGHFRVAFDNDGQDFAFPGDISPSGVTILADNIADKTSSNYTQSVTLPNIECSNCTLQLIQIMTTDPPPYAASGDLYFNCADIILKAAGGATGAGGANAGIGGNSVATAGASARGGAGSGGSATSAAKGGSTGIGGTANTGGTLDTGGVAVLGGSPGTGGMKATGGASADGGSTLTVGSTATIGGKSSSGGSATTATSTTMANGLGGSSTAPTGNGGATASGGSPISNGGMSASVGDASAAKSGASEDTGDAAGCGCRSVSRQTSWSIAALSVIGMLLCGRVRRRRV